MPIIGGPEGGRTSGARARRDSGNKALKRLLVAALIFLGSIGVLLVPALVAVYRAIAKGGASGIGFVVGAMAENIFRLVVLLLLALLAWWIAGKLVTA